MMYVLPKFVSNDEKPNYNSSITLHYFIEHRKYVCTYFPISDTTSQKTKQPSYKSFYSDFSKGIVIVSVSSLSRICVMIIALLRNYDGYINEALWYVDYAHYTFFDALVYSRL